MSEAIRPSNEEILAAGQSGRSEEGTNIFTLPEELTRERILGTNIGRAAQRLARLLQQRG
jgi:hypothetical protein